MPFFTTTIEDNSPMLVYSAGWTTGTSGTDNLLSSYSSSNFMATQTSGASVTFTFSGTGVQLFGAKRENHGFYQVTIDGNAFPPASGQGNEFQALLFTTTNLKPGVHKLVLTNQEAKFLDLDFVSWQSDVGNSDERLLVNVVQDSDPVFKYSAGWSTNPEHIGTFLGGSGHQASSTDASFTYTFQGDAVSLYGPVGVNFAPFSVQVDGGVASTFTANRASFDSQVLLYHAGELGGGQHTLKLSSQATQGGQSLGIDYAAVYSTSSLGGVSSSASGASSGLSGGAGAGITIAILAFLALIIGGFFFFKKRRLQQQRTQRSSRSFEKLESGSPVPQPDRIYVPPALRRGSSFGHMGPPSSYTTGDQDQAPMHVYVPSSSEVGSPTMSSSRDVSLEASESSSSVHYASSNRHLMRVSGTYSVSSNSTSPRNNGAVQISSKGRKLYLPAAAGQNLGEVPQEELLASRRVVEGRPQDFGAVDPSAYTAGTSSEVNPPPDYSQATEPYAR